MRFEIAVHLHFISLFLTWKQVKARGFTWILFRGSVGFEPERNADQQLQKFCEKTKTTGNIRQLLHNTFHCVELSGTSNL